MVPQTEVIGIMSSVQACPMPDGAFLSRYARGGAYVDCYVAELSGTASQRDFIVAFYTTFVFRLERLILRWLVNKPSTDQDVRNLADGASESFAAWRVEDRSPDQLLLADVIGRTKSWLMVQRAPGDPCTRLYFGSAVLPRVDPETGKEERGGTYSALLGFHKLYSRILLSCARARLRAWDKARIAGRGVSNSSR